MDNKHNNAINDDALENVSGGFLSYGKGKGTLTPKQIGSLQAWYGVTATEVPDDPNAPSHFVFTDKNGNEISDSIMSEIIKDAKSTSLGRMRW